MPKDCSSPWPAPPTRQPRRLQPLVRRSARQADSSRCPVCSRVTRYKLRGHRGHGGRRRHGPRDLAVYESRSTTGPTFSAAMLAAFKRRGHHRRRGWGTDSGMDPFPKPWSSIVAAPVEGLGSYHPRVPLRAPQGSLRNSLLWVRSAPRLADHCVPRPRFRAGVLLRVPGLPRVFVRTTTFVPQSAISKPLASQSIEFSRASGRIGPGRRVMDPLAPTVLRKL